MDLIATESDFSSSLIGEYGTLSLDHNWKTVSFNNSYTNPVLLLATHLLMEAIQEISGCRM